MQIVNTKQFIKVKELNPFSPIYRILVMVQIIAAGSAYVDCITIISINRERRRKYMNIEENIRQLLKKLIFLGYQRFQIKNIINEALGQQLWEKDYRQNMQVMIALQKYEQLGNEYLLAYSK